MRLTVSPPPSSVTTVSIGFDLFLCSRPGVSAPIESHAASQQLICRREGVPHTAFPCMIELASAAGHAPD